MKQNSNKTVYDNCMMVAPDGEFLCYTSHDRINWYLDRDFAELIKEENPRTIRLTIEPKGRSGTDDPFYSTRRKNECVVCGVDDNLTLHHVVPHCFRRFFPNKFKDHSSHDILAVCRDCHDVYEIEAADLKKELAKQYKCVDYAFAWDSEDDFYGYSHAVKAAIALLEHGDKMPKERKAELKNKVAPYLGHEFSYRDMEEFTNINSRKNKHGKRMTFAEKVVSELSDIEEFCIMWRRHFVEKAEPKYLPEKWDVERRYND